MTKAQITINNLSPFNYNSKLKEVKRHIKKSFNISGNEYHQSPYKSVRALESAWVPVGYRLLNGLFAGICNYLGLRWKGRIQKSNSIDWNEESKRLANSYNLDDLMRVEGQIIYSPVDGKPLTIKDWKKLDKAIKDYFRKIVGYLPEHLQVTHFELGKLLYDLYQESPGIEELKRLEDLKRAELYDLGMNPTLERDWTQLKKRGFDDTTIESLKWAENNAGIYITSLGDKVSKDVSKILVDGYKDQLDNRKIESKLNEKFAEVNADWRRIVVTEGQMAMAAGNMSSMLQGKEYAIAQIMGVDDFATCNYCKVMHKPGERYVIVQKAQSSEYLKDYSDELAQKYPDIKYILWPGKLNIGRKWNRACPAHPQCRDIVLPG